ncbi:MAG: nucleotide sugar dehydrogenase [Anaerococcus sp.]|uniref:nucleotide sugar dehydrogenase n=1 Tax=Anaerococcus sp. TaxID=1872515 RepID=UPI00290C1FEC|nr:nucleotide sugar dehydrogenase [Anaerococcus sp.]MDU4026649.1 nucleotide sugar dehydrogenase [Anaerococcus sp.]
MKILVFGLGYVGLANAILLSQSNEVIGIETDEEKINLINQRKSPLNDEMIIDYLNNKDLDLIATKNYEDHLLDSDLAIIAVPTNYDENTRYFDTSFVDDVITNIKNDNEDLPILIKSTIPVGYTKGQREKFACQNIIFSPEFLREGKALADSLNPSRIIVGDKTDIGKNIANLYKKESLNDTEVLYMDSTEAEAVKLFANTYLAMRVSYFNELDTFAEMKGLSTKDIIMGVSADPRIGNYYNNPSFGYGGYCLPKDSKQLYANFENVPNAMFKAVIDANKIRKTYISDRILRNDPKTVGIYRLIMKKDSDNFRKSAIFDVINNIKDKTKVQIYEPNLDEDYFEGLRVVNDLAEFKKSDIIVANRLDQELLDVKEKVYTRDIFNKD